MAPAAGRRLWEMAANTRGMIAVEWLAACQGIDLREGLTSSPLLEQARQFYASRLLITRRIAFRPGYRVRDRTVSARNVAEIAA